MTCRSLECFAAAVPGERWCSTHIAMEKHGLRAYATREHNNGRIRHKPKPYSEWRKSLDSGTKRADDSRVGLNRPDAEDSNHG